MQTQHSLGCTFNAGSQELEGLGKYVHALTSTCKFLQLVLNMHAFLQLWTFNIEYKE